MFMGFGRRSILPQNIYIKLIYYCIKYEKKMNYFKKKMKKNRVIPTSLQFCIDLALVINKK